MSLKTECVLQRPMSSPRLSIYQPLSASEVSEVEIEVLEPPSAFSFSNMKCYASQQSFWLVLVITIIFIIIVWALFRCGCDFFCGLNNDWNWSKNIGSWFGALIFLVVTLLFGYGVYIAYALADCNSKSAIGFGFLITLILAVIWLYTFFKCHNINGSLWLGFFTLLAALFTFGVALRSNSAAGWATFPFVIGVFLVLIINWHLRTLNCHC